MKKLDKVSAGSLKGLGNDAAAAVALALHLFLGEEVHDLETGVITIVRNPESQWNSRVLGFRRTPAKRF